MVHLCQPYGQHISILENGVRPNKALTPFCFIILPGILSEDIPQIFDIDAEQFPE